MEPVLLESSPTMLRFFLYNTYCQIQYIDAPENWQELNNMVYQEALKIQKLLSMFDETSELWKLNHQSEANKPYPVSSDLFWLLQQVLEVSRLTQGIFDPTVGPLMRLWNFRQIPPQVPSEAMIKGAYEKIGWQFIFLNQQDQTVTFLKKRMELDPGGWGKGWALEQCRNLLLKNGVKGAVLNFGSSLCMLGANPYRSDGNWEIHIQKPWYPRGISSGTLVVPPCSIATSAGYDNFYFSNDHVFHHLIDPRTGKPSDSNIVSASVLCPSPFYADILSTVIFIGGEHAGKQFIRNSHSAFPIGWHITVSDGKEIQY